MAISSIVISPYATSASYHTNKNKFYCLSEPAKADADLIHSYTFSLTHSLTQPLSPSSSQTARKIAHTRLSSSREKPRTQPIRGTLNNAKPRSIQKGQTEPESMPRHVMGRATHDINTHLPANIGFREHVNREPWPCRCVTVPTRLPG